MLAFATSKLPLDVRRTGQISTSPYQQNPGFGANPWKSGFRGGCGCSPTGGCDCGQTPGLHGFLDTIGQNVSDWFTRFSQSPDAYPSGTLPSTQSLQQYAPYLIGALVLYKLLK